MMGVNRTTIAALAALGLSAAAVQARDLRLADVGPPDSPSVLAAEYMNEVIRNRTGGRHSIEIRQADQDSENFTIGSVRNGMLDMARVNVEVLNSLVPATVVPTLPYLFRSTSHMRRVLDGPIGEEILASMSSAGVIGLCFYDMGAHSFYSRSQPIRRAEDLRGLMVRVQPASSSVAIVRVLDATPVPIPASRAIAAFKAGVIDADDDNSTTYISSGHFKIATHYGLTKHSMTPGVVVFSKIVWDQLPQTDRAIIRVAAKESVARMRASFDASELAARHQAEQAGVEVIDDVDRNSFAAALMPLHSTLIRDAKLQDMVKRIQADDGVARQH
jgi:TRAP-type C4-dicarboxylate transport system substrate-binding protein